MRQIFETVRNLLLEGIKWIFAPLHFLLYVLFLRRNPYFAMRVAHQDELAVVQQENARLKNEIRQLRSQSVSRQVEMEGRIDKLEKTLKEGRI